MVVNSACNEFMEVNLAITVQVNLIKDFFPLTRKSKCFNDILSFFEFINCQTAILICINGLECILKLPQIFFIGSESHEQRDNSFLEFVGIWKIYQIS